jgi:EAL domain-containing protein (putative c-di-GMP-specific phosphodiesterase class I)
MTASTKASAKELLRAIEEDQLRLHYQPIVSLQAPDLRVCGYEALVRWQHPDRGLLFPAAFLPTPTQVNVIDFKWQKPLFDWVFARACKTAATLKGEKYISVNVSPLQFAEEGFIQQVKKSIDLLNLERKICLEITEDSISMRELDAIQQALTSLSDSTKIALDDAWTGSSSLWRISELHGTD